MPQPGEVEREKRDRLSLMLRSSSLGKSLLEATSLAKFILQYRPQFQAPLGDIGWSVTRKDLEVKVIRPYVQKINGQLNQLLSKTGISEQAISQVICSGGTTTAIWSVLEAWLNVKLPNAKLVKDVGKNSLARVASGLAYLPRYPQILNRDRQQYSDYFLLAELLRNVPPEPVELAEIMQILEKRGINTNACYERLLALIDGQLPTGFIPVEVEHGWLSAPQDLSLTDTSLFLVNEEGKYQIQEEQVKQIKQHLRKILADKRQRLTEPLSVDI
ncbi:MAG: hypothetical protein F6K24_28280 [Okeania sp. SIO2D1]|nr:hypothetical protein [Okeania sp. SIO2D1]